MSIDVIVALRVFFTNHIPFTNLVLLQFNLTRFVPHAKVVNY